MQCQIQWVDSQGNATPDSNDAVAMAHHHEAIWSLPCGGPSNHIVGYSDKISASFPICQMHLDQAKKEKLNLNHGGWSFGPISQDDREEV